MPARQASLESLPSCRTREPTGIEPNQATELDLMIAGRYRRCLRAGHRRRPKWSRVPEKAGRSRPARPERQGCPPKPLAGRQDEGLEYLHFAETLKVVFQTLFGSSGRRRGDARAAAARARRFASGKRPGGSFSTWPLQDRGAPPRPRSDRAASSRKRFITSGLTAGASAAGIGTSAPSRTRCRTSSSSRTSTAGAGLLGRVTSGAHKCAERMGSSHGLGSRRTSPAIVPRTGLARRLDPLESGPCRSRVYLGSKSLR